MNWISPGISDILTNNLNKIRTALCNRNFFAFYKLHKKTCFDGNNGNFLIILLLSTQKIFLKFIILVFL